MTRSRSPLTFIRFILFLEYAHPHKRTQAAKPKGVKATVLYDWAGEHAGDLSITEDEIVHIEHVPDEEDWYVCREIR